MGALSPFLKGMTEVLDQKGLNEIAEEDLVALIENGVPESIRLEYKQATYGNGDSDKREFLKDVSSFANSAGGNLFIGMSEVDGVAQALTPIQGLNVDAELRRLESLAQASISPPIPGLQMHRVPVTDGDTILVRIPRSWNPPHQVTHQGSNRFYARNSAQVFEMNVEQLRTLFNQRLTVEERAGRFIGERIKAAVAGDPMVPIHRDEGLILVHLVPLPDFGTNRVFEVMAAGELRDVLEPIGALGANERRNLYGFCYYRSGQPCRGYTQLFRNGAIEATCSPVFTRERHIPALEIASDLIFSIAKYVEAMSRLTASPPILVSIVLLFVRGCRLSAKRRGIADVPPFPQDELRLPGFLIERFADRAHFESEISKALDVLWNAFDLPRCDLFDIERRWVGAR
jgi:Putative DNA-binding domain